MIIDAENQILGRVASHAAENAMLGKEVNIVNSEKAIVTGSREEVLDQYRQKKSRGVPRKGPYIPRRPDKLVRRTVRGMIPYKKPRGEKAFKRINCHIGVPEEFEGEDVEELPDSTSRNKLRNLKYVYVNEICKELGAKHEA